MDRGWPGRRRDRSDESSRAPGTGRRGWSAAACAHPMGVDSALAMGTGGYRSMLVLAAIAVIALLSGAAPAGAATYPVNYDFSQGLLAQAARPDSPPPGANDWSCRPSASHPRPVVLVHGLLANQTDNWQTISPLLATGGYCVFSLTYGTRADASFPGYQPGGLVRMEESA